MLGHPKPGPAMSAGRGRTRRTALGLALTAVVVATVSGCGLLGGSDSSSASSGNLEKSKIKVSILPATEHSPRSFRQGSFRVRSELGPEYSLRDDLQRDVNECREDEGEKDCTRHSARRIFHFTARDQSHFNSDKGKHQQHDRVS